MVYFGRGLASAASAVILMAGSGCGLAAAPNEYQSGAMGANAEIGDISLLSVHVEAPPDPSYLPGSDARLRVTFVNDGLEPDTLTSVSSPAASDTQIRWDADCDGEAQVVPELPLRPAGPAQIETSAGVPPFDAYHIRLVGLNREILAGTTIPVTFVFEHAGEITVETLVQPNVPRAEPSLRCYRPGTPAPAATG